MKLRNKKTGEIVTLDSDHNGSLADFGGKILVETNGKEFSYDTLAELNEEWEDYKPAEPLIKDEKKRLAVEYFFDLVDADDAVYQDMNNCFYHTDEDGITYSIDFGDDKGLEKLKNQEVYTIAELCGEEEE